MICVFDSCVWISAFHFGGTPLVALKAAHNSHRIAICESIDTEVRSALTTKFRWPPNQIQSAFDEFRSTILKVAETGRLYGICRDPKDDMVFECALVSGARVIVSGDKDLLAVRSFQGIRVLTHRRFLTEVITLRED